MPFIPCADNFIRITRRVYYKIREIIEDAYKNALKGKPINWDEIFRAADSATESVFRNKDAFFKLRCGSRKKLSINPDD